MGKHRSGKRENPKECSNCGGDEGDCNCGGSSSWDDCYGPDSYWGHDGFSVMRKLPFYAFNFGFVQTGTVAPAIVLTTDATTGVVSLSPVATADALMGMNTPLIVRNGMFLLISGLATPNDVYNKIYVIEGLPTTANPVYLLRPVILSSMKFGAAIALANAPAPLIYTVNSYDRDTGAITVLPTTNGGFNIVEPKYALCKLNGGAPLPDFTNPPHVRSRPAHFSDNDDSSCSDSDSSSSD